ncbi:MAG TPA: hypothetical protein DIV86_07755, partial [Alphaproteobacteria bacterium]|nr:hypothetical protein [Alphaproteobacteria bacterium]
MADSLAIVGVGPSNTNVFVALQKQASFLSKLAESEGIEFSHNKIYLIDFDGNHGAGKAWGANAHPSFLFDSNVGFLKDGFREWLKDNKDVWLPELEKHRDTHL